MPFPRPFYVTEKQTPTQTASRIQGYKAWQSQIRSSLLCFPSTSAIWSPSTTDAQTTENAIFSGGAQCSSPLLPQKSFWNLSGKPALDHNDVFQNEVSLWWVAVATATVEGRGFIPAAHPNQGQLLGLMTFEDTQILPF